MGDMTGDGSMTTKYTVWCRSCLEWDQIANCTTKKEAKWAFRAMGWNHHQKYGWECPRCSNA